MKVESITFLSDLTEDVKDIFDDNVYVVIKLDNSHEYIVVTQKNLLALMNN